MLRERNTATMRKWMPYIYHLLNALEKLPPHKTVTYRGLGVGRAEVQSLYKDLWYETSAFTHTHTHANTQH